MIQLAKKDQELLKAELSACALHLLILPWIQPVLSW